MAFYLWGFLRPFTELAYQFDVPVKVLVFLLSVALLAIAFLAYRRTQTKKFLFVAFAFLFFALKWGFKVVDIFLSPGIFLADASENVFELLIFVSLFLALFRK